MKESEIIKVLAQLEFKPLDENRLISVKYNNIFIIKLMNNVWYQLDEDGFVLGKPLISSSDILARYMSIFEINLKHV